MKNVFRVLSPLLLLCAGLQATTMATPRGSLLIGTGGPIAFTSYAVPDSKLYQLNVDARSGDYSLAGNATVNQDPWIDYGFSFKNLSAVDLSFTILLEAAYSGGPYQYLTSSHSGSVTDSGGVNPPNGQIAVTPVLNNIHQPSIDNSPVGGIMGGCSVSGAPGKSYACGQGNINGLSIATGATGTMSLLLSGTVSPGDVYTFNGLVSLSNQPNDTTVPEPTTVSMAVVAIGAATLLRRRMAA